MDSTMPSNNKIVDMPKVNKGVVYQHKIYEIFSKAVPSSILVHSEEKNGIDIPFSIVSKNDNIYGVEVKQKHTDTMAGTSLRFANNILSETPVKSVDAFDTVFPAIRTRLTDPLSAYVQRANVLILEHNAEHNTTFKPIAGFPADIPVAVRIKLKTEGLQRTIQSFYAFNLDAWKAFYIKKGSDYIHIGNKGLFHLGKNPLNLPVPELTGTISIEVRLLAAGTNGKPIGRVEIAVKFKDLKCSSSPYSLDNAQQIHILFSNC